MAGREDRHWIWGAVACGLIAYAFVYDNANSWPSALGYNWTRLTTLGREARLVEIPVIAVLLGLALTDGVSRLTRTLLAAVLIFIGIGLLSYYRDGDVPLLDAVRLVYMWVLPAFMFIIGRELRWPSSTWRWVSTLIGVWVVGTIAVSWVQLVVFTFPVGDDITGLAKDAHANGTLLMFVALQALAAALFLRKPLWLAVSLILLVTMVLCSVLKVMFFGMGAIALLIWLFTLVGPRRRSRAVPTGVFWGAAGLGAVGLMGVAFANMDAISSNRLGDLVDKIVSEPGNFGPIQAHRVAVSRISGELTTLGLGMGPFHLANPISVGQLSGSLSMKATGDVLAIEDEKGEQARITLSSSLLGEFGVPAFVTILFLYGAIGRAVWRTVFHPRPEVRWRGVGLVAAGFVFALIPVASLFGSFDVISVTWVYMLSAGLLCRAAALPSAETERA